MQKIIVHSSLLWLAFIAFTLTARAQKTGQTNNSFQSRSNMGTFMQVNDDSSYNPVRTFIIYRHESLYNITMAEDKVLELSIDGRKLPADSFHVYDPLIRKITEQIKRDRAQALRDQEQAGLDRMQAQRDKQQAERDVIQAQRDKVQAELDQVQAERDVQQAIRDKEQAERDVKRAEEDRAMLKALINDVVKDGLAPDEKSVNEVRLDEYEFILNGKKQSDEIFKKYKDKYMKTPTSRFSFHR
jgi:hypothetical protein